MKKLVFCCLCVFVLMACNESKSITGRWAMEIDGTVETSILMPDDSIVTPELQIGYDTIHMEVKSDGRPVDRQFVGVYSIDADQIRIVDRYGKEQVCKFVCKEDLLIISEKDDPDKIIMRLRRIKE